MENISKIKAQGVNFDRIDEYIDIRRIKKEYKSDKMYCWLTALKFHSIYILIFLAITTGTVLSFIEDISNSYSYTIRYLIVLYLINLCAVSWFGVITIGRFIQGLRNYQAELNVRYGFELYFMLNHKFKYSLDSSNISEGTFFIKEGVRFKSDTTSDYVLCYRNKDAKVNTHIQIVENDAIQTPKFDILKMTLYIPNKYKMPKGEEIIYINVEKHFCS